MSVGRVDAINLDDNTNKAGYTAQAKKKNPWDFIGFALNGINNINLPSEFNSAFTVGKDGGYNAGIARG